MNGSRSTPSRHGDRSSLDALNRTIEGLEARIEGLMSGTARDGRQPPRQGETPRNDYRDPRQDRRPSEPRAAVAPPVATSYRAPELIDPLAEIRERQRMLEANRAARIERPRAPDPRRTEPSRADNQRNDTYRTETHREEPRREESRYAAAPRRDVRPPEAYRPQEAYRQADPYRQPERPATARPEAPRYAEPRQAAAVPAPRREEPRREETRRPAPQPQQSDNGMREIAQALVSLRQELKQDISEGVAREMTALRGEIRAIKSVAEDQHFANDLRGDLARMAESINQLGYQATPEAAGLRAEFEELRTVMDGLAREDSVRRMETRWQGLEDRMQHDGESAALRDELVALAYRIDDIKSQLGEMSDSPVIRALEQKLITVAGAMEQIGSRMQPNDDVIVEQFATLDQRLDEISRAIAAGSRAAAAATIDQSFLQRLEGRIGALAEQIDVMSQQAHTQIDPTEALATRIEALTGRIEELADEQAAVRLEERLEQLSVMLEQAQRPVPADLSDYLADISRKIDGLEHGSVNDVLAERLDFLARRIEEIDISPRIQPAVDQQAFGRIEDRLSDIAARLDEATVAPRNDDGAIRNLEDQIAHLATLISQPQTGAMGLTPEFDNRMAAIENYMATNDEYIIEAARQAAEAVVEAYSRNTAGGAPVAAADMAALSGLADDLRHLEDLTRGSEERTQHTFEALHGTLVQIADRLDGMEERLAAAAYAAPTYRDAEPEYHEPRRAPAMPVAAPLQVAAVEETAHYSFSQQHEDEQPVASFGTRETPFRDPAEAEAVMTADAAEAKVVTKEKAAKTSLLTELSRRFLPGGKADAAKGGRAVVEPTPSLDPSDVLPADRENDLLEPGSGAPDVKKILERVRASQAAGEFSGDRTGAADRADYIAAARRAAKAAAQETDPSQGAGSKNLRKPGTPAPAGKAPAGKGIGATFSQHRRPILMAVGAVLLVLMALPIAGKLTGATKSPAPTAKIEAPAKPAAPAQVTGQLNSQPTGQSTGQSMGQTEIPTIENQAATDGVDSDTEIATAPPAMSPSAGPADPAPGQANSVMTQNHLTDPRPAAPNSIMQQSANNPPAQDRFVAAPKAEAPAAIVVPAGIEPKSLADAAAAGDPNALFEIGARFTEGRGVKSDLSEAANWYKLAADRGLAPAQYRLANLFEKGTGVSRDLGKAVTYYKQAADQGNASAMHNLAVLYASGATGQPDYQAAVGWFSKAADYGVADSQFNLAILFARGNGVKQDLEESYKWFAVAAKDGDKDAAQKRDEVANSMRKEQLESARAKVDLWKVKPLDPKANSVNLPDEWASGKPLTTASVDMDKAIRNIQALLNKNGFDAGQPDGKMGGKTVAAIKAFQTSVGQEPSGKVNDAFVKELLARNK